MLPQLLILFAEGSDMVLGLVSDPLGLGLSLLEPLLQCAEPLLQFLHGLGGGGSSLSQ